MCIPADAQVQQIVDGLVRPVDGNGPLPYQPPQSLGNLNVKEVWRMQGLVLRKNSTLYLLPGRRL
jgi:hypothetical protein